MAYFEIFQTTGAIAALAVLLFLSYRLKRSLKGYARTGSFR